MRKTRKTKLYRDHGWRDCRVCRRMTKNARNEHLKATIHRAVASLPGQTAVPTQDYET